MFDTNLCEAKTTEFFRENAQVPMFIMLVGLPGSGKSSFAETILVDGVKPTICSSDGLREELFGDASCQNKNGELFNILHKRMKNLLQDGKDVIFDATNISKKNRRSCFNGLGNISYESVCCCIMTPYETCLDNNLNRDRKIPASVIRRMYESWNPPGYDENFDEIWWFYSLNESKHYRKYETIENFLNQAAFFDQENSHHTLSLWGHCRKAYKYVEQNNENHPDLDLLCWATALHDCGKLRTKSEFNSKGEYDGNYHYYNHHCCGAYDAVLYSKGVDDDSLTYISTLIYYHTHPCQQWKSSEKCFLRDRKLLGEKMIHDILALHVADLSAR